MLKYFLLSFGLVTCCTAAFGQVAYRPVALTGDVAPVLPPLTTYYLFGRESYRLNDAGKVLFDGTLTNTGPISPPRTGLFSEAGTARPSLIASEGSQALGVPFGVTFTRNFLGLSTAPFNESGMTAFRANLEGNGAGTNSNTAICIGGVGVPLTAIAVEGSQAAGLPLGVTHSTLSLAWLGENGQVAFQSSLSGTGVGSSNNSAVFLYESGVLGSIAREGDQAPGLSVGVKYASLDDVLQMNIAGSVAFCTSLTGTGVDLTNRRSIFSSAGGQGLRSILRTGDQVADLPGGVLYEEFASFTLKMNNAGQVLVWATLTGDGVTEKNDNAVVRQGNDGVFRVAVREGDQVNGMADGIVFAGLGVPQINDQGQLALIARIEGSGVGPTNEQLVCVNRQSQLGFEPVARTGDHAVGMPEAFTYAVFQFDDDAFQFNNQGQVAFFATLSDGIVESEAIYATTQHGILYLVAAEGVAFDVNPDPLVDDYRTVMNLVSYFDLNNYGELAFHAAFTDGSSGLFSAQLYETCPADTNHDGILSPADFTAWIAAFNALAPECDQNDDGLCSPGDFTSWIANFNAGC